ncbi:MAG: hypothetical protein FWF06_01180 [Symbiobacteriaceae bacterium]|nr:hypothetical protein [Symbiobacteriaceae bacterium]
MNLSQTLAPLRRQVVALIPVYEANGKNVTRLYTRQGEIHTLPNPVARVLEAYLDLWGLKAAVIRRTYADDEPTARISPLALQAHHTLVPLKARLPYGKSHHAYGYLESESLQGNGIPTLQQSLQLTIASFTLEVLSTKRHVAAMRKRAYYAAQRYLELNPSSANHFEHIRSLSQWVEAQQALLQQFPRVA